MKFLLYLGVIAISFAIGECDDLKCFHCYVGKKENFVSNVAKITTAYPGFIEPPVECKAVDITQSTGVCKDSTTKNCVTVGFAKDAEKITYYGCTTATAKQTVAADTGFTNTKSEVCAKELCNRDPSVPNSSSSLSSMFVITSLAITLVLLLLFS